MWTTHGTSVGSAILAVRKAHAWMGLGLRSSRHIACPEPNEQRNTEYCAGWRTCHLDQSEFVDPCGRMSVYLRSQDSAHREDHSPQENGDIERGGHGGRREQERRYLASDVGKPGSSGARSRAGRA